ncbi:MAG: hypothetical protein JST94_00385 [Bacteroidetes bacterium]|nr:hypothetical protein [Bacteroidota bacterium]MBS1669909.1 hypothetical protein [Bacteroidota bacterium]
MNTELQNKIENTINSFDGMQRAEMPPFFQTRLIARLLKENEINNTNWFTVKKPVWIMAVLAVLLIANTVMLTQENKFAKSINKKTESTLQSFASEYNLSSTTNY